MQSFRFPDALRDFYRYIRIDFHSHYSNEYYCPLSLLRVYGLTHLEEWKWDMWKAESRTKQVEALKLNNLVILSSFSDTPSNRPSPEVNTSHIHSGTMSPSISRPIRTGVPITSVPGDPSSSAQPSLHVAHESTMAPTPSKPEVSETPDLVRSSGTQSLERAPSQASGSPHPALVSSETSTSPIQLPPVSTAYSLAVVAQPKHPSSNGAQPDKNMINGSSAALRPSSSQGSPSATAAIPSVSTGPPISSGGESVYKVIMNKVASLETNYTLYTLYMEQQNSAIRELIKRLSEDIGRLEAVVS